MPASDRPTGPFVLIDDARAGTAGAARLYRDPTDVVVARRATEVLPALEQLDRLARAGAHLAGMLSYEAGLALEPRLAPLLPTRIGETPLVWFGAFDGYETIPAQGMPAWLAAQGGSGPVSIGPLEPQLSPGGYRAAFERIQAAILAGDIYQANLTFLTAGPWSGDPLALYAALRPKAAAGHGGVVHDGTQWQLSFSPELLFALQQGRLTVRPMKGTRSRGRDAAEDALLHEQLAASAKDRAENLMIVDLLRNDLSRVAQAGSVAVDGLFAIESYPTVHQMVSTVQARLASGATALDVLRALFPCGSVTGAPKIRAMELIADVERDPRQSYCGSMGWIDPTGDAAFNVAIRTLRLASAGNGTGVPGGRAVLGVGSAVVADSQALPEWRECLVKGGFVRQPAGGAATGATAAARFDLIETMRFTPEDGIPLLELHLERLRTSAEALGFSYDRHALRNAIQALCFNAERPSKLRIVAARSGAYSLELSDLPEASATDEPLACVLLPLPVDEGDWRLRHKSTDRGFYEAGRSVAHRAGAGEALFVRDDGLVTEGCFTNLFVERDGVLLTPPAALGLLPGVLRRSLLDEGRAREAELTSDDLIDGFFVGNALRGLMPARLIP